jgi:hypothetical protein
LPTSLGSFNAAEALECLKCRLWINRNLRATWRAKLLVLMDFSNRAEVSEELVSFSHIFRGRCVFDGFVTDARGICTTRDSSQALYALGWGDAC